MVSYEQRKTFLLLSYWNSISEENKIPNISQVSVGQMHDLWDYTFVLNVENKSEPVFTHFGSELAEIFGSDFNNQTLEEARSHPVISDFYVFMDEVWVMQTPVSHCAETKNHDERLVYRNLLAPLSGDNENEISYMIGTTNFKVVQ